MAKRSGRPGARRIRTIKPEILYDAKTRLLSDRDWRLFVSSFLLADDEGRFEADTHVIGPDVFGYAATEQQVDEALRRLHELDLLELWTNRGRRLGRIVGWKKHQRIDEPSPSSLPGPEEDGSRIVPRLFRDYSGNDPGLFPADRMGGDGNGRGMGDHHDSCEPRASVQKPQPAAAPGPPLNGTKGT